MTVEAGQFLGEDGAFQEGWQNVAFEEGDTLRDNPTLANIKDLRTLARQVVSGESTIGKLSGGRDFTIIPNEQSDDEERTAHYTKLGRPESAEGYELDKVQVPEGMLKDDKFIAKMAQSLFEGGASKKLAQKLMKDYMDYSTEALQSIDTEDKLGNTEADKQLHTILGSAYDTKMATAHLAIEAFARPIDNEFAETLKKELPFDVMAAQMLIKIGEVISSDSGLKGTPSEGGFTPGDARAKANEIMANPYYVSDQPKDKSRNMALHKQLVEEVERLLKVANE